MIADYAGRVEYHARRRAARGRACDIEDYRQDGWIGLLQAAQRHDGYGAQLQTFADARIRGQIVDGIRNRHPLGQSAARDHADMPMSLDAPGAPDPGYLPDIDGDINLAERARAVRAILAALPERWALILRLRYYDELSMDEIAERAGMTVGAVSRLHSEALSVFRGRWAKCVQA